MAGIPFFVQPLAFTVNLAGNERAETPASHLAEFQYRGMVWRSNGTSNLFVRFNLTTAPQDCNFIALLGTNAIPASTQIQVLIYDALGQTGNVLYNSGASPPQNMILPIPPVAASYHSHLEFPVAAGARSGQIIITGHTGDFEAAFMVIGNKVSAARYYEPEWESGPEDFSTIQFSRNGVPEIASGVSFRSKAFTLGWLTEAEFETKFQPMLQSLGRTNPVFLSFDPEVTTYRQARTYFGTMRDTSRARKVRFNQMEKKFEILSKI